jgi:Uma2 family endonuclease
MVGCDKRDTHQLYLRYPKILVEVTSPSTERLDRCEKWLAYQTIETLAEYVLIAQDRFEVTIFRRARKWKPEVLNQRDDFLLLKSIDLELPIGALCGGVTLG